MSRDRKVLITGGGGSIGSAVVALLLQRDSTREITVFDTDEQRLFELERKTSETYPNVTFELGDVRNTERLTAVMRDAEYVIHAAGLKHVAQSESHPYESMQTNATGTWNVVQAANRTDVKSVITVSTDKAVHPTSTMGATKMLAERITHAAAERTGSSGPRFGCVRLGNVLESAGSVVPLFHEQIKNGGPVTITDSRMTRFVISKRQAANFILDTLTEQAGGGVHIPKIDRVRLVDLADALIEEYAPPGTSPEEIETEEIGRRPAERLHEYLIGPMEVDRTIDREHRYVVRPPGELDELTSDTVSKADLPPTGYRSDTEPFLNTEEIQGLLKRGAGSPRQSKTAVSNIVTIGIDDTV